MNIFETTINKIPPHLILLFMIFVSIAVTISGAIFLILKFQKNTPDVYKQDENGKLYKVDGMKELSEKVNNIEKVTNEILLRMKLEKG